ncbi:hypothetical protein MNEG_14671 [Monoraphidium neglectum]|uniref:PARP catalytic domain-containing protein n=1 Tax=Monoraphidium neglectum TaxID=145388 RepID=A0A0D2LUL7_9CHLO|nr:hypothetical protein MNEG_14671 [Monoraphidium neglectum]KIY93291.1 hypothetical protein MNEG_14671 [Monoraphidium neglectum]|eukprot:XP_013892311.1 hypothetical protein MNEG_14671 [Monoraphidium neglectum]
MGGALGAGVYFAGNATYSHQYSAGQAQNAAAGLRGAAPPPMRGMPTFGSMSMGFAGMPMAFGGVPVPVPGGGGGGVVAGLAAASAPPGHQWAGRYAMLLCSVTLGSIELGRPGMRICNNSFHGVSNGGGGKVGRGFNDIYAVFDNSQAYPGYIVHYDL